MTGHAHGRAIRVILGVLLAVASFGVAQADPPPDTSDFYGIESLTVADATLAGPTTIQSDGEGPYDGSGVFGGIIDRRVPTFSGLKDLFFAGPNGPRNFQLNASVVSATPLECHFAYIQVFSHVDQDWFNTLSAGPDGSSELLDAFFNCGGKGNDPSHRVYYGAPQGSPSSTECVVVARQNATTWTFEAPSSCTAWIYQRTFEHGQAVDTLVATGPAPFSMTAVLATS